jgi:hypothetical protein
MKVTFLPKDFYLLRTADFTQFELSENKVILEIEEFYDYIGSAGTL